MKWLGVVLGLVVIIVIVALIFVGLKPISKLPTKNSQQSTLTPTSIQPSKTALKCVALTITSPQTNQKVTSPLNIEAVVDNTNKDCHWTVFEAQAGTAELQEGDGTTLGTGLLKTTEEWTTDQPVKYQAKITFAKPGQKSLKLLITEEKPNGGKPQIISVPLVY